MDVADVVDLDLFGGARRQLETDGYIQGPGQGLGHHTVSGAGTGTPGYALLVHPPWYYLATPPRVHPMPVSAVSGGTGACTGAKECYGL